MFDSQVLDTAIGLVFIYFFLSIFCSACIEFVSRLIKKRAKMLQIGIETLLQDPKALENLYQQPFFMGNTVPGNLVTRLLDSLNPSASNKTRIPSDISSRSFVLSLLASLKQHPDLVVSKLLANTIAPPNTKDELVAFQEKVKQLKDGSSIKKELEGMLADSQEWFNKVQEWYKRYPNKQISQYPEDAILKEIISGTGCYLKDARILVEALPDDNSIKMVLRPLLQIAGDDINKAFESIEKWYDEGMERVTGWYKKYSQTFAVILACFIAVALNADSFEMAKSIYRDKVLRESLVKIAANAKSEGKAAGVVAPPSTSAGQSAADKAKEDEDFQKKVDYLNTNFQQISSINMPFGWSKTVSLSTLTPEKFAGILFTVLMVSLGSNFWFDLLSKLLNMKDAGKADKKSQTTP